MGPRARNNFLRDPSKSSRLVEATEKWSNDLPIFCMDTIREQNGMLCPDSGESLRPNALALGNLVIYIYINCF